MGVTVELVCDSKAVCDEKWAKLQELICNGELAKELTDLFKKDVKIDGKVNGCPTEDPPEGNLLPLLALLSPDPARRCRLLLHQEGGGAANGQAHGAGLPAPALPRAPRRVRPGRGADAGDADA